MTTGQKITRCRKEKGITQAELAETLGVSRQAVSRWESDLAFPETDKLVKLSNIFGCSVDWLLKYDEKESGEKECESGERGEENGNLFGKFSGLHFEYKSRRTVGNLPLVHINIGLGRTAKGVFAVGIKSVGIVSVGLLSLGVVSIGTLALGLLSLGCLALGILSLGAIAAGLLSAGGVAVGFIAVGGCAVGAFALGGAAIGGFSFGGYANGSYIAIGDIAVGGIALGSSSAEGGFAATVPEFGELAPDIYASFDKIPSVFGVFTDWCRSLFEGVLNGRITLGG